jgi:endoglucanase
MKHLGRSLILPVIALLLGASSAATAAEDASSGAAPGVYPKGSFVDRHGKLAVKNLRLVDEKGEAVLLRGISMFDFENFGKYANDDCVKYLADDWHVTVLRMPVWPKAFKDDPSVADRLDQFVESCEKAGIYCIIDWHILFEKSPLVTTDDAKRFFAREAQKFAGKKHVLYEICNEPNGSASWYRDVKPYAEKLIPVIRQYDPNAIVIVGTPTWSQDVHIAARNPIRSANVMYAFHFYAGTHEDDVKSKLEAAFNRIPVFCTECGSTNATGDGGPFPAKTDAWLKLVEGMGISWCDWSLSDANEASAILKHSANPKGGWTDADLNPSGLYVRARLAR